MAESSCSSIFWYQNRS